MRAPQLKTPYSFFQRTASLAIAFLIPFSGTPSFSTPVIQTSTDIRVPASSSFLASETFQIPSKLGRVESYHSGKGKTLIHIQTAHGHYEAQKKIAAILQNLENQYGTTTIFIEGSWGKLYPELLRFFPEDPKLTHELNDILTHKAIVKGEELYLIDSKRGQGYGIENEPAYLENAAAFASVGKAREASAQFLKTAMDGIDKISAGYLNNDLRNFLRREESFQNGVVPLGSWIEELRRQVLKQYDEDLSDSAFQLEWPMLVRFFAINKLESSINAAAFDSEKAHFLKEFDKVSSLPSPVSSLKDSIVSLLSAKGASMGLQAEAVQGVFIQMMRALPKGFDYSRYPNVKAMIGLLLLQSELDPRLLTQEIERLTGLLSQKMATQPIEKQFLSVYQRKILLTKLLNLELTPDDYEKIDQRPTTNDQRQLKPSVMLDEIQKLNSENRVRGIAFEHAVELDAIYEKALAFYAGAKKRDQYLIDNVEKQMDQLGVDKAVVITGGFHAEPFRKHFAAKNYTYALLMPAISTIDDAGREAYLNVMNEQFPSQVKSSTANTISRAAPEGLRALRSEVRGLPFSAKILARIAAVSLVFSASTLPVNAQQGGPVAVNKPFAKPATNVAKKPWPQSIQYTADQKQMLGKIDKTLSAPFNLAPEFRDGFDKSKIDFINTTLASWDDKHLVVGYLLARVVDEKESQSVRDAANNELGVVLAIMFEKYEVPVTVWNVILGRLLNAIKQESTLGDSDAIIFSLRIIVQVPKLDFIKVNEATQVLASNSTPEAKKQKEAQKAEKQNTKRLASLIADLKKKPKDIIKGPIIQIPMYINIVDLFFLKSLTDQEKAQIAPLIASQLVPYAKYFQGKKLSNVPPFLKGMVVAIKYIGTSEQIADLKLFLTEVKKTEFDRTVQTNKDTPSATALETITLLESRPAPAKARPEARSEQRELVLDDPLNFVDSVLLEEFRRLAQEFTNGIISLVAVVRSWAGNLMTNIRSLLSQRSIALPPIPSAVPKDVASIFQFSQAAATQPVILSEPFDNAMLPAIDKTWTAWARYLAVNPEARWVLWASEKNISSANKFVNQFLATAGAGFNLRGRISVAKGTLNLRPNDPRLAAALAPNQSALEAVVGFSVRIFFGNAQAEGQMASRIQALELLKGDLRSIANRIVSSSQLAGLIASFNQLVTAISAFASAA